MKCIVLVVLSYAAALNAYPYYDVDTGLGIRQLVPAVGAVGTGIGTGIGTGVGLGIGTGLGLGIHGAQALGNGILGVGLGAAQLGTGIATGLGSGLANGLGSGLGLGASGYRGGEQYNQGGRYGSQQVNNRVNAGGSSGYHNSGNSGYHNRGQHHASQTSITQSEQSDNQDVGAHNSYNNGALSDGLYNKNLNGASNFGSNYGEGLQNQGLYN